MGALNRQHTVTPHSPAACDATGNVFWACVEPGTRDLSRITHPPFALTLPSALGRNLGLGLSRPAGLSLPPTMTSRDDYPLDI
jgi:hypothetical protein